MTPDLETVWTGASWRDTTPPPIEVSPLPLQRRSPALRSISWQVESAIWKLLEEGPKTRAEFNTAIDRSDTAIRRAIIRMQKRKRISARFVSRTWIFFRLDRPAPRVIQDQRLPYEAGA